MEGGARADITGSQLIDFSGSFLFDADGVPWLGGKALPGVEEFFRQLLQKGFRVFVLF